jgi:energy-coupling factor transport system substrate-specific component
MTGWAMLGLEAAGRNPLDVGPRGRTPIDYMRDHLGAIRAANELELAILGLEAAGIDSSRFAGRDLVADLRRKQGANGSWGSQVNVTAYAVLALRAAGTSAGIGPAGSWLRAAQRADGGWGFGPSQPSDPDSTGAAMQGLAATGAGGLDPGIAYLRRTQRAEGGWGLNETGVTNSQSTAWAVQGLVAAGVDPAQVQTRGRSGLSYLAARQRADGSYAYNPASAHTPVWVTSQALLAVTREALPVEPVPRSGGGAQAPSPDVEAGVEPPVATAPGSADAGGANALGGAQGGPEAKRSKQGGDGGEGSESRRDGPAPAAAEVLAEQAASAADESTGAGGGDETGVWVAAGLGGLALALGGGWFWYRRQLP